MIQRGLIIHSSREYLTCVHHQKQIWTWADCMGHFSTYKNSGHFQETPPLQDLADIIQRGQFDQTTDHVSVLRRYFGEGAVKIMFKQGWERGQG